MSHGRGFHALRLASFLNCELTTSSRRQILGIGDDRRHDEPGAGVAG
jgi:hypothetical protein